MLFADGTVSVSGPVWVPDSEVKEEITPLEVQASIEGETAASLSNNIVKEHDRLLDG